MPRFIEGQDRHQVALLPESLDKYLAGDNAIRVVVRIGQLSGNLKRTRRASRRLSHHSANRSRRYSVAHGAKFSSS